MSSLGESQSLFLCVKPSSVCLISVIKFPWTEAFLTRDILSNGTYINLNGSNLLDKNYLFPIGSYANDYANKGVVTEGRMIMLTIGRKF